MSKTSTFLIVAGLTGSVACGGGDGGPQSDGLQEESGGGSGATKSSGAGGATGGANSTVGAGTDRGTGGENKASGGKGVGGSEGESGRMSGGGHDGSVGGSKAGGGGAAGDRVGAGGGSGRGGAGTAGSAGASKQGGAGGSGLPAAGGRAAGGGGPEQDAAAASCSTSDDTCPAPKGGVTWNCKKRFSYGVNYAWAYFGGDFGGISAWSQDGVAGAKTERSADLKDMKDNGVDVIRWWMFPDLRGDGIKLDGSNSPSGLGATVLDDVNAALSLAAELDLHLKLTLFSFDNFCADRTDSGLKVASLQPIVVDASQRAALIANVVVPIAKAVEQSPNKDRMVMWDVINEPEWAISGSDGYGDQDFDPQSKCNNGAAMQTMTFAQAETFVKEVVTALHGASSAPVTVGSAAVKWAKAWSKVGLDVYDFHWYAWVDQYFAHTKTPKDYGVDDKPVVVGEFPLNPASDTSGAAFGGIGYGKLIDDFLAAGYAGTQGWAFSDTSGAFSWADAKANVKAWAADHACYTHY